MIIRMRQPDGSVVKRQADVQEWISGDGQQHMTADVEGEPHLLEVVDRDYDGPIYGQQ